MKWGGHSSSGSQTSSSEVERILIKLGNDHIQLSNYKLICFHKGGTQDFHIPLMWPLPPPLKLTTKHPAVMIVTIRSGVQSLSFPFTKNIYKNILSL